MAHNASTLSRIRHSAATKQGNKYLLVAVLSVIPLFVSLSSSANTQPRPPISGFSTANTPGKMYASSTDALDNSCGVGLGMVKLGENDSHPGWYQCSQPIEVDGMPAGSTLIGAPFHPSENAVCQSGQYADVENGVIVGCYGVSRNHFSSAAVSEHKPYEYCGSNPSIADPVIISTRQSVQTEVDYTGGGRFPLTFVRTFRSNRSTTGGDDSRSPWTHNYSMSLEGALPGAPPPDAPSVYTQLSDGSWTPDPIYDGSDGGPTSLVAHRSDGTRIYFLIDAQGNGSPDSDIIEGLAVTTLDDGNPGIKLSTGDGTSELYDLDGRLVSIKRISGDTHQLHYDPQSGLLSSVATDYGHKIEFTYDADDRIERLTLPDGRYIEYT